MSQRKKYKYAELPVFKYQTFDRSTCTFTNHPIIPVERFQFTSWNADNPFQSKEPDVDPDPEILDLDPPSNSSENVPTADDEPGSDGMFINEVASAH